MQDLRIDFTGHLKFDAVTLVKQPIQDRVGERGFAEIRMRGVDGKLTRHERRTRIPAVIEDFQQIGAALRGRRREPPVVEHDQRGNREV